MSLVRDFPIALQAFPGEALLVTCSAIFTTAATTAYGIVIADSTADTLVCAGAETTGFGRVIDRLRQPLGTLYGAVVVNGHITSTRGSTEADRKLTIGCRVQHGDSSAGGDMADFSTGSTPSVRTYFSTARTTDMLQWDGGESSGPVYAVSTPGYYDLTAAKRYVRVAVPVFKNKVTTESSGDEQCRVGATMVFLAGQKVPQRLDTTGPYSSSTSTS